MSVWLCIPSKRPVAEANACFQAWQEKGYKVAIARERDDGFTIADQQLVVSGYQGWPRSTNLLINAMMAFDASAEWFIAGGDDYFPDPSKPAEEIAEECVEHFHGTNLRPEQTIHEAAQLATFGVMQPTGDRWGERNGEATIDRIAGSPWLGREFCRRMYHGTGPLYNGYFHNFADEELQNVALNLGVFWQRRDLVHEHRHWARPRGDWRDAPEWAHKINNPEQSDWHKSKALFAARKAAGFPGHEPLGL